MSNRGFSEGFSTPIDCQASSGGLAFNFCYIPNDSITVSCASEKPWKIPRINGQYIKGKSMLCGISQVFHGPNTCDIKMRYIYVQYKNKIQIPELT